MKKTSRIAGCVLLVLGGALAWHYLARSEPLSFGAGEQPEQQGAWFLAYGYAMTLLGILLGAAYRELQARRAAGVTQIKSVREFTGSLMRGVDLWMSLFGSPIVYGLIVKSVSGGGMAGLTTVALQNGFCCTVLISSFMKNPAASSPSP